jgi:hypothetical protein
MGSRTDGLGCRECLCPCSVNVILRLRSGSLPWTHGAFSNDEYAARLYADVRLIGGTIRPSTRFSRMADHPSSNTQEDAFASSAPQTLGPKTMGDLIAIFRTMRSDADQAIQLLTSGEHNIEDKAATYYTSSSCARSRKR